MLIIILYLPLPHEISYHRQKRATGPGVHQKFEKQSIDFSAPDESRLDITNAAAVADAVAAYTPDVIVNCAAYNSSTGPSRSRKGVCGKRIGAEASGAGGRPAEGDSRPFRVRLCFRRDERERPVREDDQVNPLNEYGKSKRSGEDLVREACGNFLIFRLSWVYGAREAKFYP